MNCALLQKNLGWMGFYIALIGLVASSTSLKALADTAEWPYKFAYVHYIVLTPPNMQVKRDPKADFDIYTFFLKGRPILDAYVGNNPKFPLLSGEHVLSKNRNPVNELDAKTIQYKHSSNGSSRETLVTLKLISGTCCQYVHFYYHNDSRFEAAVADSIISSME